MKLFAIILVCFALRAAAMPQGFMESSIGGTNCVGWWNFDQSGSVMTDLSGTGNTGYLSNSPSILPGVVGKCMSLKTNSNLMNVLNSTNLTLLSTTNFTVSAWLLMTNPPSGSIVYYFLFKGPPSLASSGWFWCYRTIPPFRFEQTKCGAANQIFVFTMPTNQWIHVCVVQNYSGATPSNAICYTNGVSQSSFSQSTAYPSTTTNDLSIGGGNNTVNGGAGWAGSLDDVSVFKRALTAAEVLRLYNGGRSTHRIK